MKQSQEIEVYKDYVLTKAGGAFKRTVSDVAVAHGITRGGVYDIVRRIENGNTAKLRVCTERSRLDCLWKYKYQPRYLAIPKNREAVTVAILAKLIREMAADKFPTARISSYIGKDRSTVLHHLEK